MRFLPAWGLPFFFRLSGKKSPPELPQYYCVLLQLKNEKATFMPHIAATDLFSLNIPEQIQLVEDI